jgi:glycosyltransferase involved in cell wall biosynthesis
MRRTRRLVVIETHPVQYRAPVYRALQQRFGIPVTAIYGSDCSVTGYRDAEFGRTFAWDTDLLSGYQPVFMSRVTGKETVSAGCISTRGLRRALRAFNPAAVLLTGYSPSFHQKAFGYAWHSRLPILFRGETTDCPRGRTGIMEWARHGMLRWFYGRCRWLLYVGTRSNRHFRNLGCAADKLVFAPYCVDTAPFRCGEEDRKDQRAAVRRNLGIEDSQVVILFSGKLSTRKGPDLVIEAVRLLDDDLQKRVVVVFLGSGEMESMLRTTAANVRPVTTRFVGFQNQSGLSPYYHAADLMVLPSRHSETWGLVVNEALHHGVPCIVSDAVGCAPDLVEPGRTGEIAETGSSVSLAAAVQRGLNLMGRPDIRDECRSRVSRYTVEKAAAGIAQAYWAVVN